MTKCATGRFNPLTHVENNNDCQLCTSGAWCKTTGLLNIEGQCDAGYFCLKGATDKAPTMDTTNKNYGPCPNFLYCDTSSGKGVGRGSVCFPGTYKNS